MKIEYSKKDIKMAPKNKSVEVKYEDGFWRFEGAVVGYPTEEEARKAAEKFMAG